MRKFLLSSIIVIVTMSILWIFAGRQISEFIDRFATDQTAAILIQSIEYQGSGEGGTLTINKHPLSLAPANPHVGSTKDNELAIAHAGKVFAFGPLGAPENETLHADVQPGDRAILSFHESYLPWPSFRQNNTPELPRHHYWQLVWKKDNAAKVTLLWSLNENDQESLIRVEISDGSR